MDRRILDVLMDGPSPTARRIDGMRDARNKGIRLSHDPHYTAGYDHAVRMQQEASEPDAARPVKSGLPAVCSFHS